MIPARWSRFLQLAGLSASLAGGGASAALAGQAVFGFGMTVLLGTPSFSPDGKKLLYDVISGGKATLMLNGTPVTHGEDVFPGRPQWIDNDTFLYAADGHIKRRSLVTGEVAIVPFSVSFTVRRPQYAKKPRDFDSTAPQRLTGIQRAVTIGKNLGTVAPGKVADLVFVDGDPLTDIRDAMKVRDVMVNGFLYSLDELVEQGSGPDEKTSPPT